MNSPKNDTINRNIPLWQQLLSDRYILQSALKMNWIPLIYKTTEWRASGWVYFTYTLNGEIGRKRWKNSDKKNQGGDKYRYISNKTSLPQPVYYHHPQIKSFIANANGILFLVGGEPDVLSMHTLGTYNCLSYLGENNVPSILVDNLRTLGVKKVIHLPNTDAVGIRSAQKTRDKLAGSGIIYKALQLPVKDVNDLLILLKGDIQRCLTTIHDLPLLDLPAPKPVQLSKRPASPYPLPTGSTESVIVRIKSQIALADYIRLDTELKRDGSARLAGRTPWRNERTPSLKIYQIGRAHV